MGVVGERRSHKYLTRAQGRNTLVAPLGRQGTKVVRSNQGPGVRLEFVPCVRLDGEDGLRRPWSDVARRRVSVLDLSGNRVEPARWRILVEATSAAGGTPQPSRNYAADYVCDPVIFIRSAHGRDGKGGKRRKREREGEKERGGTTRGMPRLVPDESDEKLLRPASASEKERVKESERREECFAPFKRKRERENDDRYASHCSQRKATRSNIASPPLV